MSDIQTFSPAASRPTPLYRIRELAFAYANSPQVLSHINLDIAADDRIALVGPNGSGKTTLIKQFSGLLRPNSGQIHYKGKPLNGKHLEHSRLEIGVLFQDPDDQLFGHTLLDDAAFGPRQQGLSQEQALRAARKALQQVYLDDLAYKAPHHLSFGQKKRAALAGLLAMQPAVLLLDEPTANLDPRQEQVFLDLLKAFTGTLVCISHDLIFLYELCRRAIVIERGSIVQDCPMDDLVSQRDDLRAYGLDFSFRLVVSPTADVHQDIAERKDDNHEISPADPSQEPTPDGAMRPAAPALIELAEYSYRYPDGTPAISDVRLIVNPRDRIALVGQNGAGKTSLLACLLGLQQGDGTYRFEGKVVTRRQKKYLWRRVGLVFQDSADQLFCPSVYEEIAFSLHQSGFAKNKIGERVRQVLALVHLEDFEERVPLHMSGGERKRLALACILAMSPDLLILDEPTAGLDPQGEELLLTILKELDTTLLLVSHDMFFVEALTTRTLVMHHGHIIEDLPTDVFMQDPRLGNLNGLSFAFRQRGGEAIRALQHEHEHNHPHRHRHSHPHHHGQLAHDHYHEHAHEHPHRFLHTHPGEDQPHDHPPQHYHDHNHPDHDKDPDHHL